MVYSTFLGGKSNELRVALGVDPSGVITVAGQTESADFPTTAGAFDRTFDGPTPSGIDGFVSRLDPRLAGVAQLAYSTFLGGSGDESIWDLSLSPAGTLTIVGGTSSKNFPTTSNAFATSINGSSDGFVTSLDLNKVGASHLIYSTFLGGSAGDGLTSLVVDARGSMTLAGGTDSTNFPTRTGAFQSSLRGGYDCVVCRLDVRLVGAAQLTYSTYLGGTNEEWLSALSVNTAGEITIAGLTQSLNFPTTSGAFDTTYNGGYRDSFVSRLDPSKPGASQLTYSTFVGGKIPQPGTLGGDLINDLAVDGDGVITVAGYTNATDFPTTRGSYNPRPNGEFDIFVSRLDPRLVGASQLVYSTFLGGKGSDFAYALHVDPSGTATVAGFTLSTQTYPTTPGAYAVKSFLGLDAIVTRLDMGMALYGDVHTIPITTGGRQRLTVNAGRANANRLYWIFGSISGTQPGTNLLGVHIPLNPDQYTDIAMGAVNTTVFTRFKGTLDSIGFATAAFKIPANLSLPPGLTFHHAYVVYDASGTVHMASNAVPLRLR